MTLKPLPVFPLPLEELGRLLEVADNGNKAEFNRALFIVCCEEHRTPNILNKYTGEKRMHLEQAIDTFLWHSQFFSRRISWRVK